MRNKPIKMLIMVWLLSAWQLGNAQMWEILNPLPEGSGYYRGHFLDDNNGWVFRTGSTQLLRTRDGGNTWAELYPMTGMRHIFMVDTLVGYMIVKEGVRKYLFRTTDGGANWEQKSVYFRHIDQSEGYSIYLERKFLYFINPLEGFLIDDNNGKLMRTSDGGDTWSPTLQNYFMINDIVFLNDTIGYVGSGNNCWGNIYYTDDGGLNWTQKNVDGGAHYHVDALNNGVCLATYFCSPTCYGDLSSGFIKTYNNFETSEIYDFSNNYNFLLGKYFNDSMIFLASSPKVFKMHRDSINPQEVIDFSEHLSWLYRIEAHKRHAFLYGNKIVRYTDTAYVGIANPQSTEISKVHIYPNPAMDKLYFEGLPATGQCKISLITLTGETVKEVYMSLNHAVDISDLQMGLYFINIQHRNFLISRKIIINPSGNQ